MAPLVPERDDQRPQLLANLGIESDGRLVEQHDLGLVDQRPRDQQPALHPSRQRLRAIVRALLEAGDRQRSIDRGRPLPGRHPVQAREHLEHVAHAQVDVEVALLRADAHPRPRELRFGRQTMPEHLDRAAVGHGLAGEDPHRRRLAGAVGPEQAVAEPRRHLEVESVDGAHVAKSLDHAVQRHRGPIARRDLPGGGGTRRHWWVTTNRQRTSRKRREQRSRRRATTAGTNAASDPGEIHLLRTVPPRSSPFRRAPATTRRAARAPGGRPAGPRLELPSRPSTAARSSAASVAATDRASAPSAYPPSSTQPTGDPEGLGHAADRSCHRGEPVLGQFARGERIVAMGVVSGRDEHELRLNDSRQRNDDVIDERAEHRVVRPRGAPAGSR